MCIRIVVIKTPISMNYPLSVSQRFLQLRGDSFHSRTPVIREFVEKSLLHSPRRGNVTEPLALLPG
jgi:hypothetical protein